MMWRNSAQPHPVEAHRVDSLAMFYTSIGDGQEGVAAFREKRDPRLHRAYDGHAAVLPLAGLTAPRGTDHPTRTGRAPGALASFGRSVRYAGRSRRGTPRPRSLEPCATDHVVPCSTRSPVRVSPSGSPPSASAAPGAALVVGTSADEHTADAPRARETARTSGSTEPADIAPTRTESPSRGGHRHHAKPATPSAPAPTTATETPDVRPTPTEDASVRVRATVRDTTPTSRACPLRRPRRGRRRRLPPTRLLPTRASRPSPRPGPAPSSSSARTARPPTDAAWTAAPSRVCAPAVTLTDLTPGWHTLAAQAVDPAGNADPTPAQTRWHANGVLP